MIPRATRAVKPCPFGGHYHQSRTVAEEYDTHLPEADTVLPVFGFVLVFDGLNDFSLAFSQIVQSHDPALGLDKVNDRYAVSNSSRQVEDWD